MVAFAPLHNHHMERLRRLAITDSTSQAMGSSSPAFRFVSSNCRCAGGSEDERIISVLC